MDKFELYVLNNIFIPISNEKNLLIEENYSVLFFYF